jgi:hypothetical protein
MQLITGYKKRSYKHPHSGAKIKYILKLSAIFIRWICNIIQFMNSSSRYNVEVWNCHRHANSNFKVIFWDCHWQFRGKSRHILMKGAKVYPAKTPITFSPSLGQKLFHLRVHYLCIAESNILDHKMWRWSSFFTVRAAEWQFHTPICCPSAMKHGLILG